MDTYLPPEPLDSDGDVDPYGPDSGLAALVGFCERSGLPLPPLPEHFIPLLKQVGEAVFTSRDDLLTLTDFDALIAEAVAGEGVPFVALSHEGFGINSWHLRFCVSLPAVKLFAAVGFGGFYMDPESDRATVEFVFERAAILMERALSHTGGRSFVTDYRGIGTGRWCEAGGTWHDDTDAFRTVADLLTG